MSALQPVLQLLALCAALLAGDGWLGVFLTDAERPTVHEVVAGSPAEAAGIKPGDVFLSVDGKPCETKEALVEKIGAHDAGDTVALVLERNGKQIELKVKLGKRPAAGAVAPQPKAAAPVTDKPEQAQPAGRPYLGLEVDEGKDGLSIVRVVEGSPAGKSGLRSGDRLVGIGGADLEDLDDLDQVIGTLKPGQEVEVRVVRGDRRVTAKVVVGSAGGQRPPAAQPAERPALPAEKPAPKPAQKPQSGEMQGREAPPADAAAAPPFRTDWDAAVAASQESGKPLLVMFGAGWCAHSAAMRRSMQDPAVREASRAFVAVYIDTDQQGKIADEFRVQELPTLVVQRPGQKLQERMVGYQPPESLARWLRDTLGRGAAPAARPQPRAATSEPAGTAELRAEVERLRAEVAELRALLEKLSRKQEAKD
jgi:thiol-disulfide isomerase/thioredoxin